MRDLIAYPTTITIDALKESKDEEPASTIPSVLGQLLFEIPSVKFLITGRPEHCILDGFRPPLLGHVRPPPG